MPPREQNDEYIPETALRVQRRPEAGEQFIYGSNSSVIIETVTDQYVYLSNGIRMKWTSAS